MTLRHDMVLVALDRRTGQTVSGLHLAQAMPPMVTSGRVLKAGPHCREVKPRDYVAFPASAIATDWQIGGHPCLLIRETEIAAVIEASACQEFNPA